MPNPITLFTQEEISLAREIKNAGLSWIPNAGHYVYDEHGLLTTASPFQDNVYFILDIDYFIKKIGTLTHLTNQLIWLPTWEDARLLLSNLNVNAESICETLQLHQALQSNTERLVLYKLILAELSEA